MSQILFLYLFIVIPCVLCVYPGPNDYPGGSGDLIPNPNTDFYRNGTFWYKCYADGYTSLLDPNDTFSSWMVSDLKVWRSHDPLLIPPNDIRWVMEAYMRFDISSLFDSNIWPLITGFSQAYLTLYTSGGHEAVFNSTGVTLSVMTPGYAWNEEGVGSPDTWLTWDLAEGWNTVNGALNAQFGLPPFGFWSFPYYVNTTSFFTWLKGNVNYLQYSDLHLKLSVDVSSVSAATFYSRHVGTGPILVVETTGPWGN